jgi:hypothetical protein
MLLRATIAATLLAFVVGAAPASAQGEAPEAGTVVTMEGKVEIGHAASFSLATVGSTVRSGDTVRTGNPGRVRILFRDESVLNLGDDSTLVIDESVFDPDQGTATTLMRLLGGKVRALVSEYYGETQSSYRVETTTAVSGVRGTEFIVRYDPSAEVSDVLGLSGSVAVHSPMDRVNRGVVVGAMEVTTVEKGKFPTPPRLLDADDELLRELMAGLDLPGGGLPESVVRGDPAFGGDVVPPADQADEPMGFGAESPNRPVVDQIPDEPGQTPGDILDQPAPVLEGPTDVIIDF